MPTSELAFKSATTKYSNGANGPASKSVAGSTIVGGIAVVAPAKDSAGKANTAMAAAVEGNASKVITKVIAPLALTIPS